MKRIGILLLVVVMSLTLVVGCSTQVDEDFENEENDGVREDVDGPFNYEISEEDLVEGKLLVSLDAGNLTQSVETEMIGVEAMQVSQSQVEIFANSPFEVKDSLLGYSETGEIQSFSPQLTESIVDNMGFVHVVEYDESDYDSIEEAAKDLLTTIEASGETQRYVEPYYEYNKLGNVHRNQQWHYNMVNAPEAWETTRGSSDVSVAVLDTGIDANHQDLSNFVDQSLGRDFTGDGIGDRQGHGTHVAGTIASYNNVSGVMQNATLIDVKVLGDSGGGSPTGIQRGVLYAADIGADVMNMSLGGGGYSQAMADAVETAHNAGTVVIAASGNDGRGSVSYPSGYEYAMSVGAVDRNRNRTNFSNYGSGLDIVAPGQDIYSTYPNNSYQSLAGTSMAAPHVAGVAGLLRAADRSLSADEVWDAMVDTAQNAGPENQYGAGIVDAAAALDSLGDTPQPDPDPEPEPDPDPEPEPEPEPEDLIVAIQSSDSGDVVSRIEQRSWWTTNVYIRERAWGQDESQMWNAKHHGDGVYSFINLASGNALDINSYQSGDTVLERDYTGADHQQWRVHNLDNDAYALQNKETGYVLSGEQSNSWWSSSDRILQNEWTGASNQQWDVHVLNNASAEEFEFEAKSLSEEDVTATQLAN